MSSICLVQLGSCGHASDRAWSTPGQSLVKSISACDAPPSIWLQTSCLPHLDNDGFVLCSCYGVNLEGTVKPHTRRTPTHTRAHRYDGCTRWNRSQKLVTSLYIYVCNRTEVYNMCIYILYIYIYIYPNVQRDGVVNCCEWVLCSGCYAVFSGVDLVVSFVE